MKRWLLVWVLPLFSVLELAAQQAVKALPPPSSEARGIDRLQPLLPALEEAQSELQRHKTSDRMRHWEAHHQAGDTPWDHGGAAPPLLEMGNDRAPRR